MNHKDRVTLIADLLEQIHFHANQNNLDQMRELLALTGESNQIGWAITASGLKEFIHRLFLKAHALEQARSEVER